MNFSWIGRCVLKFQITSVGFTHSEATRFCNQWLPIIENLLSCHHNDTKDMGNTPIQSDWNYQSSSLAHLILLWWFSSTYITKFQSSGEPQGNDKINYFKVTVTIWSSGNDNINSSKKIAKYVRVRSGILASWVMLKELAQEW